jgi:p-aminobenzoyl-glutamate transporter AbgT
MAKEKAGQSRQEIGSGGFLKWIEELGNKLPHPFWIFVWICILIVLTSAVTAWLGVSAVDPGTGRVVEAQNLLSGEGLRRFVEHMVSNFAYFAPFGLVLVMLMGVSIAEGSGLLAVALRTVAFSVPRKIVLPVIFIIGACGNIGSDAGVVIVPPIAALIFSQMGLSPIAGLIAGYAGATAGFTANFFIAGTDVLLAGISTEITHHIDPNLEVSATANWYFMIASTFLLGIGGAFVARRYTIPRCRQFVITGAVEEAVENPSLSAPAQCGNRWACAIALSQGAGAHPVFYVCHSGLFLWESHGLHPQIERCAQAYGTGDEGSLGLYCPDAGGGPVYQPVLLVKPRYHPCHQGSRGAEGLGPDRAGNVYPVYDHRGRPEYFSGQRIGEMGHLRPGIHPHALPA